MFGGKIYKLPNKHFCKTAESGSKVQIVVVHSLFYQPLKRHGHGIGWNVLVVVLGTFSFCSDFLNSQI